MATDVIDLREWRCAECGAAVALLDYEGDSRILRCEDCADDLGPNVIRLSSRTKTKTRTT